MFKIVLKSGKEITTKELETLEDFGVLMNKVQDRATVIEGVLFMISEIAYIEAVKDGGN